MSERVGLGTSWTSVLVGWFVAGRMASRSGVTHGLLVALVALVITIRYPPIGASS
jgi:hypothetical protein